MAPQVGYSILVTTRVLKNSTGGLRVAGRRWVCVARGMAHNTPGIVAQQLSCNLSARHIWETGYEIKMVSMTFLLDESGTGNGASVL